MATMTIWLYMTFFHSKQTLSAQIYEGYIEVCDTSHEWLWHEAEDYCESNFGTTLSYIHSEADHLAFQASRDQDVWGCWIGLRYLDDEWQWTDGSPYDYNLTWRDEYPTRDNNTCVSGRGGSLETYHDRTCVTFWRYCFSCWNRTVDSLAPTTQPSVVPSVVPTDETSQTPTTQYPSLQPTISPTSPPDQTFEFVESGDISFKVIESQSYTETFFNPGYYNLLYSEITVSLDNSKKTELFETWLENADNNENKIEIQVTPKWRVYDVTDSNADEVSILTGSCNSSLIQTTSSLEDDFVYTSEDETTATYSIYSYCVLYSDASVNEYSVSSICSAFDSTYFTSGNTYKFENTVEISTSWQESQSGGSYTSYTNYSSSQTKTSSFTLVANTPPSGGNCTVSPSTGFALEADFNFSCSEWSDTESTIENVQFNFIKDKSASFLNTFYSSSSPWASSTFSTGSQTVTAVIIDDLSLATCQTIYVTVEEPDELSGSPENFTSWVTEVYTTSVSDILASSTNDADQGLARAMSVLETAYEVTVDYSSHSTDTTDTSGTDSTSAALVELQEDIISTALTVATSLDVDTEAEAVVVLSTLAGITMPIVTEADVHDVDDLEQGVEVYSSSIVSDGLNVLSNVVVDSLSSLAADTSVVTSDTAQSVFQVLSNVQGMRRLCDEDATSAKQNGNIMADTASTATSLLLKQSVVGESYSFVTETLRITATKISATSGATGCACNGAAGVELSQELLDRRSNNGENHMDCTVMNTDDNIYESQSEDSGFPTFYSSFVLIEVISDSDSSDRRRLASTNESDYLSSCQPIIIAFESSDIEFSAFEDNYPTCSFYNETTESYEGDGCYVVYSDQVTGAVQCACLHLTYFGVTAEEFVPEINFVNAEYLNKEVSWQTFVLYPLGWVSCLVWIAVCVLLILLFNHGNILEEQLGTKFLRDIEDVPLMVQQNALFVDYGEDGTKKHDVTRYRSVQEIMVIQHDEEKNMNYCLQLYHLWRIAIRNDHSWLGICYRNNGTFYDSTQRIAVMMVRLLTTMAVSALFYGISKDSVVGDIMISFYESMLGSIPIYMLKHMIKRRQPSAEEIKKFDINVEDRLSSLGLSEDSTTSGGSPGVEVVSISQHARAEIVNLQQQLDIASEELRAERRKHVAKSDNISETYPFVIKALESVTKSGRRSSGIKRVKTKVLLKTLDEKEKTELGTLGNICLEHGTVAEVLPQTQPSERAQRGHHIQQSTASVGFHDIVYDETAAAQALKGETSGLKNDHVAHDSQEVASALEDAVQLGRSGQSGNAASVASASAVSSVAVTSPVEDHKSEKDATRENAQEAHAQLQQKEEHPEKDFDIVYTCTGGASTSKVAVSVDEPTANELARRKIEDKLGILNELRLRLFESTFYWPPWIKIVSDVIIAVWSIGCAVITTLWVMWFDQELTADNNYGVTSECPDSIDVPEQTFLNFNETQAYLDSVSGVYTSYYNPPANDSWGDNLDVSARFMYSVLFSYFIGVVVWQPLITLALSIWKLRKLHKHSSQYEARIFFNEEYLVNWNDFIAIMQLRSGTSSVAGAGGSDMTNTSDGAGAGDTQDTKMSVIGGTSGAISLNDAADMMDAENAKSSDQSEHSEDMPAGEVAPLVPTGAPAETIENQHEGNETVKDGTETTRVRENGEN